MKAVDNQGRTPLHWAAEKGHTKVVEMLFAKGASVKAVDNQGCTPLRLAAGGRNYNVVRLLLGKGATTDELDEEQILWIHAAARKMQQNTGASFKTLCRESCLDPSKIAERVIARLAAGPNNLP